MDFQEKAATRRAALSERQVRRWKRQQKKILSAAGRLFWKKGYNGTSIDDIAKLADVNKATIYYYFKDKPSLLNTLMLIPMEELLKLARQIAHTELRPTERLKSLITTHVKWQISQTGVAAIGHVERKNLPLKYRRKYISMRDKYEHIYRETIKNGIENGDFSFYNAKIATLFTLGLVNSIMQWYKPKGRFSADEIAKETVNYVLGALKAS